MKKLCSLILALIFLFCAYAYADLDISSIDLKNATDEELESLRLAVVSEQRSRIKTAIVFDKTELSISKNSNVKLVATVMDLQDGVKEGKLEWSTSDKSIATVQNGNIKGVNNGNAVITCSTVLSDGTELSSDCTVTVYTPVKSIRFKNSKAEVILNSEKHDYSQEVTIQPADATNQTLKFESSDPRIASVDGSGLVAVHGVGTVTITAYAIDGSETKTSYTLTSRIDEKINDVMRMHYFPRDRDGNGYYSVWSEYKLHLDGFSVWLAKAQFEVYDEAVKPLYAYFHLMNPYLRLDDPPESPSAFFYVCKIDDVLSDPGEINTACDDAVFFYMMRNLTMYNDPSTLPDGLTLGDRTEQTETVISGEPCLKKSVSLFAPREYPDTGEDKMGPWDSTETYMYYFPSKGYVITLSYYQYVLDDNNGIIRDPDELLSSILIWD